MNTNNRYFQWTVGERRGEVMVFDRIETDDENNYIVFKDNSRINEIFVAPINVNDLTGKLMAEIEHPDNCWGFKEEWVGEEAGKISEDVDENGMKHIIPSVTEIMSGGTKGPARRKIVRLIPPRTSAPRSSNFGVISNAPQPFTPPSPIQPIVSAVDTNDPIYILMSKSKKINSDISMSISISLPSKNLYNIAKESYENGDVKFVSYIINDIAVDKIKDALKTAITEMYEENVKNH